MNYLVRLTNVQNMHGQMTLSVGNRQDYPCETFLKEVILKTLLV